MSAFDRRVDPEVREVRRLEVITRALGRCRWSAEAKARIVAESLAPGVARRHDLRPQQLFAWRLAWQLLDEVTDEARTAWRASTPIGWANESFAISISPAVQYRVGTDTGCWYGIGNQRLDPGEPEKVMVVDRSCIETNTPIVRDRLVKAGIRLGGLLNQALSE